MSVPVTVVIPNYNHAAYLRQRLKSVAGQLHANLQVHVLDDCSNDESRHIIQEFVKHDDRFCFNFNETNSGSTFSQWNKGVSLAENDLVWIAESDDMADDTLLTRLVEVMESDASIALAYCQSQRMNSASEVTGDWKDFTDSMDATQFDTDFVMDGKEYISRFLIHRNTIPNASAVLFRKTIFEQVGGAPAHFRTNGDWFMWLKMLCFGKVAYVAEPLNYFRYHDRSVIARAHQNPVACSYYEQYDRTMRKEFAVFLKQKHILLSPATCRKNKYFISIDEGNEGLFKLKQGEYIKGWFQVLYASFCPRFKTGFIKKALRLV